MRTLLVSMLAWCAALAAAGAEVVPRSPEKAQAQLAMLGFEDKADAFSRATALRQRRVVDLFLDAKADPNTPDARGRTPLFHAVAGRDWTLAARLIAAGADARGDAEGVTPLMLAAAHGHAETVTALLDRGASLDAADAAGRTALHYAIAARQFGLTESLLAKKPRLDLCDDEGRDAFAQAVESRDWRFIQLLLDRTPARSWDFYGRSALQQAVEARDVERVRLVLDKHPGPPTPTGCKDPLLAYAAAAGDLGLARLLLEAGADPNTTLEGAPEPRFLEYITGKTLRHYLAYEPGMTVLMIAAGQGHAEMVKLLLEKGAERGRSTRSKHRLVALYFAAWGEHAECLQALIAGSPSPSEVRIEINLSEQSATLFQNGISAFRTSISSGRKDFPTPTGRFVVTDKKTHHVSSIYRVKMPYFMRLSCRDFGLHQGVVPNYPASHGCIRLPSEAAKKLFDQVPLGTLVTISY
jgi:ankyrin repeat protein